MTDSKTVEAVVEALSSASDKHKGLEGMAQFAIDALQSLGYLSPSDVEAACVAAQREAFENAAKLCAEIADPPKGRDCIRLSPSGHCMLPVGASCLCQEREETAEQLAIAIRALSPSPGPWQRVPEGTPIEDAAIWAREKAAMKRPFDEVDLELQAELQKDCLSDLDKAHAMISEVKP